MTLGHIAHHLSCAGCQEALRCHPAGPRGDGQCALALDGDREPPVWCPHPHPPGARFCDVHQAAVLGARGRLDATRDPDDPDELAALIAKADRTLASGYQKLREADEDMQRLRRRGTPEAEVFPHVLNREKAAGELGRLLAMKQEAEAELAAMNHPGGRAPGGPG